MLLKFLKTFSTDIKKRVEDIHTAFADKSVKAILTVIGGFNSNQLIKHLDYDLIKNKKYYNRCNYKF